MGCYGIVGNTWVIEASDTLKLLINSIGYLAEEVGVEPTSHFNSSSTALKAARSTGSDALPPVIVSK